MAAYLGSWWDSAELIEVSTTGPGATLVSVYIHPFLFVSLAGDKTGLPYNWRIGADNEAKSL